MKTNQLRFMLPVLCATMLCGRFALSTTAYSAPVTEAVNSTDPSLNRWSCDNELRIFEGNDEIIRDVIDTHLSVAANIFSNKASESDNADTDRRRALGIAVTDAIWASYEIEDNELATSTCFDYLLPNIDAGSPNRWDCVSTEEVAYTIACDLRNAGESDKLIDFYIWWIPQDSCPNNADANRIRLASLLVDQQRYQEAVNYLSQIDEKGDCAGGRLLLPDLQKKLDAQNAQNSPNTNGAGGQR